MQARRNSAPQVAAKPRVASALRPPSAHHREHRHEQPRAPTHRTDKDEPKGKTPEGNEYELLYRGLNAMLRLYVPVDGQVTAEAHSLIAMTGSFNVEHPGVSSPSNGAHHASRQPLSVTTFTAMQGHGTLYLSHPLPGDIITLALEPGEPWNVHIGGFLASTAGVQLSSKAHNLKKVVAPREDGFYVVQAQGRGTMFLSALGAMHVMAVAEGEQITIDPGHLVAWPARMPCILERAAPGGWSSMFAELAVVCRFDGPSTLYIQSKNEHEFAAWVRRCTAVTETSGAT